MPEKTYLYWSKRPLAKCHWLHWSSARHGTRVVGTNYSCTEGGGGEREEVEADSVGAAQLVSRVRIAGFV